MATVIRLYGRPAGWQLVAALRNETDATRRELLCDILVEVFGRDAAVAELGKLRDRVKNAERENLNAALAAVEQIENDSPQK